MLSPDDRQLVERDRLPGLACALDPDALLALLRERVPRWESGPLRITYVRYKPFTSILVGCEAESPAGTARVAVRGYPSTASDKFRLRGRLRDVQSPFGPAQMLVDDLALSLTFFPADPDIRAAKKLATASEWASLARTLALPTQSTWSVLRYKPERRLVLRVATPGETRVLKLYARGEYARAIAANKAITSANGGLQRVLAASDEHQAAVYSWAEGERLETRSASSSTLRRVAQELAAIHASPAASLPLCSRADDAQAILDLSRWLAFVAPALAREAERLGRDLADRLTAMTEERTSIHGDFYASQVLVAGDAVRVIDLDEACLGDPLADLATFEAHLEPENARVAETLIDAYADVTGVPVDSDRLALQRAVALYKLAAVPFRERSPRWQADIEEGLQRSADCLAGSQPRYSPPLISQALDAGIVSAELSRATERSLRVTAARALRLREGRRALVEYEIEDEQGGHSTLIGKVRAKGLDVRTFGLNRRLHQLGFDDSSAVAVPEPIAALPALHMWLQRRVDGQPATEVLAGAGCSQFARRAAEALHRLHGSGVRVERKHSLEDEMRILHEALQSAVAARPALAPSVQRLVRLADGLAARIARPDPLLIHRDFYSDHLIFAGATAYVIDLDLASMGDPALDAGNFIAHLIEQAIRSPQSAGALDEAAAVFADHYSALAGHGVRERIDAYTALALVRHIYISTRIEERRAFTHAIAEAAQRHLEQASHQEILP